MQLPKTNSAKRKVQRAKKLALAFLAFGTFTLLLFYPFTLAQAQTRVPLSVSPVRHELTIEPGSSEDFVFKFVNLSETDLAGSIKVADFIVRDNSGTPILLEDENLSSKYAAASWVELPFDRATIDSGEVLQVAATITAPADAAAGGRYVAVYFEPTGTLPNYFGANQQGASGILPRVAGLLYIRVAGPISESAQVVRFDVPRFVENGPIDTEFEILNLGNYHVSPAPKLTLTNLLTNATVDEVQLEEKNIFPETSRIFDGQVGKKLLIGRYRVDMTTGYGSSGQGLLASAFVWAFPWRLALLILLGIIIITLVIMIIVKSRTQKQTMLEEKLTEEIEEIEKLKEKFKDKISESATTSTKSKSQKAK